MVDITAKLFWYRSKEWYENMADKLTDIVYTDDSKETVDVVNLLLLGWILLGLIVYIVGNVIATQLRKRKSTLPVPESEPADEKPKPTEHVSSEVKVSSEGVLHEPPQEPAKPVVYPVCIGDEEEIVEWFNNVFSWIYTQRVVSPILDSWLSALNARTRLLSTEHGILVDFKDVTHTSGPPVISECFETYSSKGDLILICNADIEEIVFEIEVTQFKEKDKIVIPFIINVRRIFGRVNIETIPEDLTFITRYSEPPLVELTAEPVKTNSLLQDDTQALSDLVCEITTEALSSPIVHLRFSCYSECPRLLLKSSISEEDVFEAVENEGEEQLLVKIIKAANLGGSEGCLKPYCVVEMDEPFQRFETREVDEKYNPFWDESFTFTVKDISAELLFEIYDKSKPSKENFLGLGIVSVDELIKNPSQRQIIPLQSRPMENDNVTGSLTTEFLFLNQITPVSEPTHLANHNAVGDGFPSSGKIVETNSRVTAGGTVITTTTIKRTKEDSCGRQEIVSNLNANSNSIHSAVSNLTPVHEGLEKQILKENSPVNKTNILPNTQEMNGNCNVLDANSTVLNHINHTSCTIKPASFENKKLGMHNGVTLLANSDSKVIKENTQNGGSMNNNCVFKNSDSKVINENSQNGGSMNNTYDLKIILDTEVKNQNNAILKKISSLKDEDDFACSNVHVPAFSGPPVLLIDDSSVKTENDSVTNTNNEVKDASDKKETSEMLEMSECNENNIIYVSRDTDSSSTDMSSTLPPIAESVEVNSSASNDLENSKDGEADLPGTALKELEKHSKPNSTNKSTLIIHSVQRPDSSVSESLEASPASHISKNSHTSYSESVPSSPSQDQSRDDRSRPKEKKSIIGSLRRRLSFRKTRSKSAENRSESVSNYSQESSRSASTDRIRHPPGQKPSPFKGRFMGRQFLAVPGSTRSSLSEASGISASSSRTYINENSTLVIETNENGIIKRYLIPNSLIHRSKWKKRGIKLHIYNDHVFVAKHLSGSTTCQVCQKFLTRRPGKQGYECRGCNLQCHKSCHVKVTTYCSNSSINSMEVEYIHDPKSTTPKSS